MSGKTIPPLDPRPDELLVLYVAKDWEALSTRLLQLLKHFQEYTYGGLNAKEQEAVDVFVKNFLFLFTQPDFDIPPPHRLQFLALNTVISNVVAMSSTRTTDACLAIVLRQPDNLIKLLTLYSARNTLRIDRKRLFESNQGVASLWYAFFFRGYQSALVEKNAWNHLRDHVHAMQPDWKILPEQTDAYFSTTYIDEDYDPQIKAHVNKAVRAAWHLEVRNRANPRRIAVATSFWYAAHSACRIQYEFVKSLLADYELVLIQFGEPRPQVETAMFSEVIRIDKDGTVEPFKALADNTFRMVYFPDIGMTSESVFLANTRLAPIQVTTYGHPVSTFGGEMDYFIGSETIEDPNLVRSIYSERPVLLPGLGVVHNRPSFEALPAPRPKADRCYVNCSWFSQKVNYEVIRVLQQILERAKANVVFRFFPGGSASHTNHFVPFVRVLEEALGSRHIQVVPQADYVGYMTLLQQGSLALDSFHFGGSNVVVDSLHVRRPILCLEGARWYNRIGPALLRQVGLEDLVATTKESYVDKAVRLVNDADYRLELTERLKDMDLDELLYHKREVPHFKAAIDYLMTHHERLQSERSREPILVRTLLAPSAV